MSINIDKLNKIEAFYKELRHLKYKYKTVENSLLMKVTCYNYPTNSDGTIVISALGYNDCHEESFGFINGEDNDQIKKVLLESIEREMKTIEHGLNELLK